MRIRNEKYNLLIIRQLIISKIENIKRNKIHFEK